MYTRMRIAIGLLLAVMALGLVACGGDSDEAEDTPANEAVGEEDPAGTEGEEESDDAGDDGSGGDVIVARDLAWDPDALTIPSDTEIQVENEDDTDHTFTIPGTAIDEALGGGAEVGIQIDLEAGDYGWECTIHPSMTGVLTVT